MKPDTGQVCGRAKKVRGQLRELGTRFQVGRRREASPTKQGPYVHCAPNGVVSVAITETVFVGVCLHTLVCFYILYLGHCG